MKLGAACACKIASISKRRGKLNILRSFLAHAAIFSKTKLLETRLLCFFAVGQVEKRVRSLN